MEQIILASGSPKRAEYFKLLGLPFTCMPAELDETFDDSSDPRLVAEELAVRKVNAIVNRLRSETPAEAVTWVCGADTLITLDGLIYGKPLDREDAARMLRTFAGKEHQVWSAVALYNGREETIDYRSMLSIVSFAELSEDEINWYLDTDEWQDAAGAYKIQGLASCLIKSIKGSYSSVAGLPLRLFYVMLKDNGYPLLK